MLSHLHRFVAGPLQVNGKIVKHTTGAFTTLSGAPGMEKQPQIKLDGIAPGLLLFQAPFPYGVPVVDTPLSRQVWALKGSAALSVLPVEERNAVVLSFHKTVERSEYHFQRFTRLLDELEQRRGLVPGEVFWDGLVSFLHFEFQAFCGAVRLLIDEVLYIAARRAGESPAAATAPAWDGSKTVMSKKLKAPQNSSEEVARLRRYRSWYVTLNSYRNAFFHHGWRHGGGHSDPAEQFPHARTPWRNALLVPDQESIKHRSKPFQWTWENGATIDSVASEIRKGLVALLGQLCEVEWGTPLPNLGSVPLEAQSNLMVALFKPALLWTPDRAIFPMFTTCQKARELTFFQSDARLELARIPVSTLVVNQPAVTFTLEGLESNPNSERSTTLALALDPEPLDPEWKNIRALHQGQIALPAVLDHGTIHPISIPLPSEIREVFAWRQKINDPYGPWRRDSAELLAPNSDESTT